MERMGLIEAETNKMKSRLVISKLLLKRIIEKQPAKGRLFLATFSA